MKITIEQLRKWDACSGGQEYFTGKFPDGADYANVIAACTKDGEESYHTWLFHRVFEHMEVKELVAVEKAQIPVYEKKGLEPLALLDQKELKDTDTVSKEREAQLVTSGNSSQLAASGNSSRLAASGDDSRLAASGDDSRLAASGNDSRLAASGYYSRLAASGDDSQLAASGNSSQLAASGYYSRLAASGNSSRLAASGDDSQLAASGYYSQLAASGENSIIASSGLGSKFSLGTGGCAAIPYRDENKKVRFAVAYVGENIKADTWYQVNAKGEFVEVEV